MTKEEKIKRLEDVNKTLWMIRYEKDNLCNAPIKCEENLEDFILNLVDEKIMLEKDLSFRISLFFLLF